MTLIVHILVALVALEHLYIMYVETFAWTSLGKRIFKGTLAEELFAPTQGLAANLGLYNGFLAGGLIWSFFVGQAEWATELRYYFLGCIFVAACYGAWRSSPMILLKQGLPAGLALLSLLLA